MKVIFFGTPKEVVPVLENISKQYDVIAVVTAPDQKAGRKQLLTAPPVKTAAQKLGIPVIQPENNNSLKSSLFNLTSDLYVVAAYGAIISDSILHLPKYGAINIHPSLLPKYRGPTPIQTTLLNGDQTSGVTFIKMDKQMDHGPILHQIPFTLEKTDTFDWLMQSMFAQAAVILPNVIHDFVSGKITPQQQDETKATYTKIITKQDGYIDLSDLETLKPVEIENWKLKNERKIRAYYPWPTVCTKAKINDRETRINFLPQKKLQVEGKNPISLKDFLNGYPYMEKSVGKLY